MSVAVLLYNHIKREQRLEEESGETRLSQYTIIGAWGLIIIFSLLSIISILAALIEKFDILRKILNLLLKSCKGILVSLLNELHGSIDNMVKFGAER